MGRRINFHLSSPWDVIRLFLPCLPIIVKVMDKKASSEGREKESNRVNLETNGT